MRQLLLNIDRWRQAHAVGQVYLFYNRHRSETGYQASDARLLPVDLARLRQLRQRQWPSRTLPTYHMARQPLLARLLRQYFYVSLFRACAESLASEHASRLAAMQSAERNLDQHLETVSGEYQRRRQDAITAELLDIVGGFEALAGDR